MPPGTSFPVAIPLWSKISKPSITKFANFYPGSRGVTTRTSIRAGIQIYTQWYLFFASHPNWRGGLFWMFPMAPSWATEVSLPETTQQWH